MYKYLKYYLSKLRAKAEDRGEERILWSLYNPIGRRFAVISNGLVAGLLSVAKFSTVSGVAVSAAAFTGLAITPVGWAVIGGAFVVGLVMFTIFKVLKSTYELSQLSYRLKQQKERDSIISHLKEQVERAYSSQDQLVLSSKALDISEDKIKRIISFISSGVEFRSDPKFKYYGIFYKIFKFAQNKIKKYFPGLYEHTGEFVDSTQTIIARVSEFTGIFGLTTATIMSIFIVAAEIIGINIAKLGLIAAFTALTGLSGPIGIAILVGVGITVAALFLSHKILVSDPREAYEDKLDKAFDEYKIIEPELRTLLSSVEGTNDRLTSLIESEYKAQMDYMDLLDQEDEKRRLSKLEEQIVARATAESVESMVRVGVTDEESRERVNLMSRFMSVILSARTAVVKTSDSEVASAATSSISGSPTSNKATCSLSYAGITNIKNKDGLVSVGFKKDTSCSLDQDIAPTGKSLASKFSL